jgi:hypothetical protein
MVSLGACDGPNEQAGRERDRADAIAAGQNVTDEGPNERLGEAQDRLETADRKAKDSAADALESRGEQLRKQADIEADKLDAQARVVRDGQK